MATASIFIGSLENDETVIKKRFLRQELFALNKLRSKKFFNQVFFESIKKILIKKKLSIKEIFLNIKNFYTKTFKSVEIFQHEKF